MQGDDARQARVLAGYGAVRVGAGLALTAAPTLAGRLWLGPATVARPPVQAALRLLGVRDLVIGAGTVAAALRARSGRRRAAWALAGAAADAADCAVILALRRRLPTGAAVVAAAATAGTATGAWLATAVSRDAARSTAARRVRTAPVAAPRPAAAVRR